jgi:REP element-mobilizing transposase RayT
MPRPLRLEAEGAIYHVIARGNERKLIFRDDHDRREYLDRLIRCRERFGLRVLAYCLMGNHLHLAVERGPTKLSRVMLALQSAYTQWFNRRHGRVGHLFQGRYKAFVIEKDRYLLALVRYIHRNPVEAGLARRPQDYAWSSDRYYRRGRAPEWLDVDHVLPLLGQGGRVAVARYRNLMGGEVEETYERLKAYAQAIKGDDVFAERLLREAGVPPVVGKLTEERVVAAVAAGLAVRLEDLGSGSRQRVFSRARLIAAYLGRAAGAIPVSRMAKYFGREESTFVRGVLRLEEKLTTDSRLRKSVARLAADLQR